MPDCDLPMGAYWDKYRLAIADVRGWETCRSQDGTPLIATLRRYDTYMKKLSPYLTKPICELTFFDLQYGLNQVRTMKRGGGEYSAATLGSYRSMLGDIYRYAQDHGDAYNILAFYSARSGKALEDTLSDLFDPALPRAAMQSRLKAELEKKPYKAKSLTPEQQLKLVSVIADGLLKDGRYGGLGILLYAGLRPSECRALQWKDLLPFRDHPERQMLLLYETRERDGTLRKGMKTSNAYRRVPVHLELDVLLKSRRALVEQALPGTDIGELPICCLENQWEVPCKDFQLSLLASKVLNTLDLRQEDLIPYLGELVLESGKEAHSGDTHLSPYVLRRHFWTWLQSSTQLSDYDKRYVMGHQMYLGQEDMRPRYNNQDQLWELCQKMDRCILGYQFRRRHLLTEVSPAAVADNCGVLWLRISGEQLAAGGNLCLYAFAHETGDPIRLEALSPLRPLGGLKVHTVDQMGWPERKHTTGINTEYDNWLALQRAQAGKKGGRENL